MNINVISIFPEIIESSFKGLTGKALEKNIAELKLIDLKEFSNNGYGAVDDAPYGGGEGMVIGIEPLEKSLETIEKPGHVICLTPQGSIFNQTKAIELSKLKDLTFICGRYEGVDERFLIHNEIEEVSVGDFVLSGGEIGAQLIMDATIRPIPDVVGNAAGLIDESFERHLLEYPLYTHPRVWNNMEVPEVLLSGNHKKIQMWKLKMSESLTKLRRPDLWSKYIKS